MKAAQPLVKVFCPDYRMCVEPEPTAVASGVPSRCHAGGKVAWVSAIVRAGSGSRRPQRG